MNFEAFKFIISSIISLLTVLVSIFTGKKNKADEINRTINYQNIGDIQAIQSDIKIAQQINQNTYQERIAYQQLENAQLKHEENSMFRSISIGILTEVFATTVALYTLKFNYDKIATNMASVLIPIMSLLCFMNIGVLLAFLAIYLIKHTKSVSAIEFSLITLAFSLIGLFGLLKDNRSINPIELRNFFLSVWDLSLLVFFPLQFTLSIGRKLSRQAKFFYVLFAIADGLILLYLLAHK